LCVQVRLQKEQENRIKLELQVAELEEQVDQRTSDLSAATDEKERLKNNLDREREGRQVSGVAGVVIVWT
jgi:outer membrane murein-binding lipoprotein Lpp